MRQRQLIQTFTAHDSDVKSIAVDESEEFFVTGSLDGDIKVSTYFCLNFLGSIFFVLHSPISHHRITTYDLKYDTTTELVDVMKIANLFRKSVRLILSSHVLYKKMRSALLHLKHEAIAEYFRSDETGTVPVF